MSSIEWTDQTWNPATGCSKVSPGCKHCYAETQAKWLKRMHQPRYRNGFQVTLHADLIDRPKRWKRPRRVFVNSMSDLFHEDIPLDFIEAVFETMKETPRHQYQILTKRAERLRLLAPMLDWPPNAWMGVSIESRDYLYRIDHLRSVQSAIRFLSLEPLLGPLGALNLDGIHWVIIGGESGPGARPMKKEWATDLIRQCQDAGVACFFKQKGAVLAKSLGCRHRKGGNFDEFPPEFRIREFPQSKMLQGEFR